MNQNIPNYVQLFPKGGFTSSEPLFTAREVATYLEVNRNTVTMLARHGRVEAFQHGRTWLFTRESLFKFLGTHPQFFGGRDEHNLWVLLGDDGLCNKLSKLPRRNRNSKPVRHIESGKTYPSSKQAAIAHHIGPDSVSYNCLGYTATTRSGRFEYVYPD